ncbi:MAG: sugar phosphate isomerase/epimerase [Fuerstiella sp.]|nr:sugar phosphate isomerase/epimerase [Fuerstiella sp.]
METLITEAVTRGYRAVELRQTCLGKFESGPEHMPNTEALSTLPNLFPTVQFNMAMAMPVLSNTLVPDAPLVQAGLQAARAVSGQFKPHLRLVDLTTQFTELTKSQTEKIVDTMTRLADAAKLRNVTLSVENSIQPWSLFHQIMEQQRLRRGDDSPLQLCYDAANLLLQTEKIAPDVITRSLRSNEISMVHFKQRANGQFLESVDDGDINWSEQLDALAHINFNGVALFEIESSSTVWQSLDSGRDYLTAHGARFES